MTFLIVTPDTFDQKGILLRLHERNVTSCHMKGAASERCLNVGLLCLHGAKEGHVIVLSSQHNYFPASTTKQQARLGLACAPVTRSGADGRRNFETERVDRDPVKECERDQGESEKRERKRE